MSKTKSKVSGQQEDAFFEKVRKALGTKKFVEKRMFGGLSFLVNGNMCCGAHKRELIVRFDPNDHQAVMKDSDLREFDLSSKPSMKGWALLTARACASDAKLKKWIAFSLSYAQSLPKK
jgi:TfoX/Sxy family transcriptional regulator of competence genes